MKVTFLFLKLRVISLSLLGKAHQLKMLSIIRMRRCIKRVSVAT